MFYSVVFGLIAYVFCSCGNKMQNWLQKIHCEYMLLCIYNKTLHHSYQLQILVCLLFNEITYAYCFIIKTQKPLSISFAKIAPILMSNVMLNLNGRAHINWFNILNVNNYSYFLIKKDTIISYESIVYSFNPYP